MKAPHLSVIIPAFNEQKTIGAVVRRLVKWKRQPEVIVVANGCTDETILRAKKEGAKVVALPMRLGHDVGRAIGLDAASGEILIVVDADFLINPVTHLEPFVRAIEGGVDLALNQYPLPHAKWFHHPTAVAKRALNVFLGRPDLRAASLTSVPHAISRRALERIKLEDFAVPPVAQTMAVLNGLHVRAVAHVNVGMLNPVRSVGGSMKRLIIGDCIEAIGRITQVEGRRGGFSDLGRKREVLEQIQQRLASNQATNQATTNSEQTIRKQIVTEPPFNPAELLSRMKAWTISQLLNVTSPAIQNKTETTNTAGEINLSLPTYHSLAVIPAKNEALKLPMVIPTVLGAGVDAVCVVDNGSNDNTARIAKHHGAVLEEFPNALGHDVGRAVGCLLRPAERYLFTDADILVPSEQMRNYLTQLEKADVVLNDLDAILPRSRQRDAVCLVKRFLNLALDRPDLGISSMTAIPHAMTRHVIDKIGADSLSVPPLAQTKAILAGFKLVAHYPVNVVDHNRFRVKLHGSRNGRPLEKLILGDHLEALAYAQEKVGPRLFFPDTVRQRQSIEGWRDLLTDDTSPGIGTTGPINLSTETKAPQHGDESSGRRKPTSKAKVGKKTSGQVQTSSRGRGINRGKKSATGGAKRRGRRNAGERA